METNFREELYINESIHRGQVTKMRILAGPGTRPYKGIDKDKDRILYIEIERDGIKIEYPYHIADQLALWELVFDVWQKPEKKLIYSQKILKLVYHKLLQSKLHNFARAYWKDLENNKQG